jgi:hypothetical protein
MISTGHDRTGHGRRIIAIPLSSSMEKTLHVTGKILAILLSLLLLLGTLVPGCTRPGQTGASVPDTPQPILPVNTTTEIAPSTLLTVAPSITSEPEREIQGYSISGRRTHSFRFDGRDYAVLTDIRDGHVENSRRALNEFQSMKTDRGSRQEELYQWMVLNTSQDILYEDILTDLRACREKYGLDESTYVELIIAYVQSFEYESPRGDYIRLPVEVVRDDRGDCDERSCLLAGLLHAEGYDTALIGILLANGKENHMGVGIRSNGFRFSSSDYTFIEATTPFPIGYSPYDTRAMKLKGLTDYYFTKTGLAVDDMVGQPLIFEIRKGSRRYGNGVKAQEIYNAALRLESAHLQCHTDLSNQEKIMDRYEQNLEQCVRYSAGCENYDTYRWMYDDAINNYNKLVTRHNSVIELYTYLLGNTDSIRTIHSRVGGWAYSDMG